MIEVELRVPGMGCEGCENSVSTALRRLDEVREVDADHESGCVVVRLRREIDRARLTEAVNAAGFEVE